MFPVDRQKKRGAFSLSTEAWCFHLAADRCATSSLQRGPFKNPRFSFNYLLHAPRCSVIHSVILLGYSPTDRSPRVTCVRGPVSIRHRLFSLPHSRCRSLAGGGENAAKHFIRTTSNFSSGVIVDGILFAIHLEEID